MHIAESSFDVPAMGRQYNSQKKTAAAHSFGSSSRETCSKKQFISEKHQKSQALMASPGPVYSLASAVGEGPKYGFGTSPQRQHGKAMYPDSSVDLTGATVDSQPCKFPTTKGVHFGTDLKDNMKNSVLIKTTPGTYLGIQSPGPFAYDPKDRGVTTPREPKYSLGQKTKILATHAQTPRNVGPGSYPPTGSMGEQPKSDKRSNPSFSFGNAQRMPALKKSDAVLDPHPDIGSLSSFGRQVVSNQKSSPGYGFGTATRDHKAKTYLVQTGLDKGPKHEWGPTPQDHPRLPLEKEVNKYS